MGKSQWNVTIKENRVIKEEIYVDYSNIFYTQK